MSNLKALKERLAALTRDSRVVADYQAKNDPDLGAIVERGQLYTDLGAKVSMPDGACHWNVAELYKQGKIDKIVVGYARNSEGWHQHTWGLKGGKVVETTPSNFENTHWFGQPLEPKDAEAFVKLTSDNPPGRGMIRTSRGGAVVKTPPPVPEKTTPDGRPTGTTLDRPTKTSKGVPLDSAPARKTPTTSKTSVPLTANGKLLDASLRHQIGLRRYSAGLTKRVAELLARADLELTEKLKTRLARFEGQEIDYTGARWKLLMTDVRDARAVALGEYKTIVREELASLSVLEGAREVSQLAEAIPILIDFATVAPDQLRAIVSSRPFQGKLLKEWFKTLEQQDGARLVQAIQLGMTEGEPTPQIVRRIVGTKAANYTDGILSITRRDAMTIARTAVNHVSNTAREYVWEANADVMQARIWHSTLDGRTSAVCRARDGLGAPIGDGVLPPGVKPLKPETLRPPAHMNCRSVMVAHIGEGLIGDRPFVTDTRTRARREIDFRQIARETGEDIKKVRRDWTTKNVGRVPATTTYQDFLRRQSPEFQDAVLGKTKGKLFRTGKIEAREYVDRNGTELTLAQLSKTRPEVFRAANLDPESFAE